MCYAKLPDLPVAGALQSLILNHLNPIAIRVKHEGHILHTTVGQTLLPVNIQRLEARAGRIEIIDGDTCAVRQSFLGKKVRLLTDMAESLGLGVAVMIDLALLLLGAIVPGQFQDTFPLHHWGLGVIFQIHVRTRVS